MPNFNFWNICLNLAEIVFGKTKYIGNIFFWSCVVAARYATYWCIHWLGLINFLEVGGMKEQCCSVKYDLLAFKWRILCKFIQSIKFIVFPEKFITDKWIIPTFCKQRDINFFYSYMYTHVKFQSLILKRKTNKQANKQKHACVVETRFFIISAKFSQNLCCFAVYSKWTSFFFLNELITLLHFLTCGQFNFGSCQTCFNYTSVFCKYPFKYRVVILYRERLFLVSFL